MASIIRVKRSTGTTAPGSLNYGELGLTVGVGTHGNFGGKLFAGDSGSNPQIVGGKYYTDLLSIAPGLVAGQTNPTTASNGFVAILDQNRKVNQWNVDNLTLDANAITSTNVDGHITITPNGTGRVQFLDDDELQFGDSDDIRISYDTVKDALFLERGTAGTTADIRIADDVHFQFGTDNDARIYYDETSTDRIQVEGASWTYASSVAQVLINASTVSTASTNGALVVTGGVGIGGTVNIAGDLAVEGGDVTSNTAALNLFNVNVTTANVLGAGTNILFGATTGITTIRNATVDLDGDLNIDGGDVTSNTAALNLFNTNVTTANVLGAATALVIGATTGIATINNPTVVGTQATQNLYNTVATTINAFGAGTAVNLGANSGTLTVGNPTVVGTQATQNLYNITATTVNAFGDASTIGIGSTSATLTLRPSTVVGTATTQNLYNTVATTVNAFGDASTIGIGSTSATLTLRPSTVIGTAATQNLYNTVTTNLNFAGSATALVIGATTGITTIRNATVDLDGDLNIDGGDVTSNTAALNLFNTNVTTANVLGAGTGIVIGATTGITTIRNATVNLDGDLNVDGGDVTSNTASLNLFNTNVTTANVLGAGTNILFGATTGITTIRNATVDLDGDLNIDGGDVTTNQSTFNLLNQNATTVNAFYAANTVGIGSTASNSTVTIRSTKNSTSPSTGALVVSGGVGIASDVFIGGLLNIASSQIITGNLTVQGNTTLGDSGSDLFTITGITTFIGAIKQTGLFTNIGGAIIDNIGISSNVISTKSGGGNILYIDPYPDGLSNEGTVVIKGDLQIDGTTTTVNSNTVSANEVIFNIGDVTSVRTIVSTVGIGTTQISLDSVVGINTGDVVDNAGITGLPASSGDRTIVAYNTGTKIVSIAGTTTAGISSTTQLTLTHAFDTNTDRGISFNYNTSSGIANNKKGFFGYKDSTGNFTYIPDATITGSVVTGTKGTLDVGSLLLNFASSGISTRGSAFFDSNGKLVSTNTPEVGYASTSNYILTTDASNVPVWTDTIDGGQF